MIEITLFLLGLAIGVVVGEIRMYFYMKQKWMKMKEKTVPCANFSDCTIINQNM